MKYRVTALVLVLGSLLIVPPSTATNQLSLPSGFFDTPVTVVTQPTALAFTPDGRLLITSKIGRLYVYQNNLLRAQPVLNLTSKVCNNRERGLLGVAVDPDFAENRFIYVQYTFARAGICPTSGPLDQTPVNRISRFMLADNNTVNLQTELVLVDHIPSPTGSHNAGDLHFGADGFLYASTGDGGCALSDALRCNLQNDNAQALHHLAGKILRVARDGTIPPDNPYRKHAGSRRCGAQEAPAGSGPCQEVFASGLRNPFRFAFRPGTSELYINDVGQSHWEEINQGKPGANYGWNSREGACAAGSSTSCPSPPDGMTDPLYAYDHSVGCSSITGGVFIPSGMWPEPYDGAYLFGDYVCGTIFRLVPTGEGHYAAEPFLTELGVDSVITMIAAPSVGGPAIYYTTFGGQVRRITHSTSANQPPVARAAATPTYGQPPLVVQFDGTASSDPDYDALSYTWDFGDGAPAATGAKVTHTYQAAATYSARLLVQDSQGASSEASVRIDVGNSPPVPTISGGPSGSKYRVGESITLRGKATDAEDGRLDGSALTWEVILHHDQHTHPFVPPTAGAQITFEAPPPEDLHATTTSYLEVQLTATDSNGLTKVITRKLLPQIVDVTLHTEPPNLDLVVNDERIKGGQTITSWEGFTLNVYAPLQYTGGRSYTIGAWSDGDPNARRTIVTTSQPMSFTAQFVDARTYFFPLAVW